MAVLLAKGEAGHEHSVEEALEPRRHRPPPVWIDQHQMIGPRNKAACPLEIGFEGLCRRRVFDDIRVEGEIAETQHFDLAARRLHALFKGAPERAAKAVVAGMA